MRSEISGAHLQGTLLCETSAVEAKNSDISVYFPYLRDEYLCLMGIVQNLFLAYENTLLMKYIIPENIFDIAYIWVWSTMAGSGPFCH